MLVHPGGRLEDYLRSGAFWRSVGVGALSGSLASGAGQVTVNLLTPCTPWHSGLALAMVTGGVTGGIAGGVGKLRFATGEP